MAILNNLVVYGAGRVLGKLYVSELDVSSSLTVIDLNASTITTSGVINIGTTQNNAKIQLNNKLAISGVDKWLRINESKPFSSGVYFGSSIVRMDGTLQIGLSGGSFSVSTLSLTSNVASSFNNGLSASAITSLKGVFDNINVLDTLRATNYCLDNVSSLGGSFYVSPTLIFDTGTTILNISAISGNDVTMRIINSSVITKDNAGGVVWKQYSKVKVSAKVDDVVLDSVTGYLSTKMNTTSGAMDVVVTTDDASSLTVKNNCSVSNLRIMIYEVGNGAVDNTYPVGIYMTGYSTNNASVIDIYHGEASRTSPRVRIGKLDDLDSSITVAGQTPTGWGFFSDNAYLKGVLYSTAGQIGGWTLATYTFSNGALGTGVVLCSESGQSGTASIAGSGNLNTWAIAASNTFGVTHGGATYISSGKIAGWTIDETSIRTDTVTSNADDSIALSTIDFTRTIGTISRSGLRFSIGDKLGITGDGILYGTSVDLTGVITATGGTIGSVNIGTTSLYSGSKNTYDSSSAGFHLGSDGTFGVGSDTEYILFDGTNIEINVSSLSIGGASVATATDVSDAANTALSYLYYDSTNGLVVSRTGTVATGYNTQITSDGVNFRSGSTVLSSITGTQYTINAGTTGIPAMALTSSNMTFYNPNSNIVAAQIGSTGLTVKQGSIGGFHITSSVNSGTSINGGHLFENSFYRHSTDGTYEYEVGMKGDSSEDPTAVSGNTNLAIYCCRIPKGEEWSDSNTNKVTTFSLQHSGELYCSSANISGTITALDGFIGGFKIDSTSIHTNNIAVTSNADNSIALSSADFARTINGTSRDGLRFAIGDKFGVTGDGILYGGNVNLSGTINATGGMIGSLYLSDGKLFHFGENNDNYVCLDSDGLLSYFVSPVDNAIRRTYFKNGEISFQIKRLEDINFTNCGSIRCGGLGNAVSYAYSMSIYGTTGTELICIGNTTCVKFMNDTVIQVVQNNVTYNGFTGTFTTNNNKTVTVKKGIITSVS